MADATTAYVLPLSVVAALVVHAVWFTWYVRGWLDRKVDYVHFDVLRRRVNHAAVVVDALASNRPDLRLRVEKMLEQEDAEIEP